MRTLTLLVVEDMVAKISSRVGLVYVSVRLFVLYRIIKDFEDPRIEMSNTEKDKAAVQEAQNDDEPDEW